MFQIPGIHCVHFALFGNSGMPRNTRPGKKGKLLYSENQNLHIFFSIEYLNFSHIVKEKFPCRNSLILFFVILLTSYFRIHFFVSVMILRRLWKRTFSTCYICVTFFSAPSPLLGVFPVFFKGPSSLSSALVYGLWFRAPSFRGLSSLVAAPSLIHAKTFCLIPCLFSSSAWKPGKAPEDTEEPFFPAKKSKKGERSYLKDVEESLCVKRNVFHVALSTDHQRNTNEFGGVKTLLPFCYLNSGNKLERVGIYLPFPEFLQSWEGFVITKKKKPYLHSKGWDEGVLCAWIN